MTWTSNTYSWNSRAGYVRYYYYATVEELGHDDNANTTNVRVRFYARGAYDPQYEGYTSYGNIYIDGSWAGGGGGPSTLGTSWQQICYVDKTITHNEDGTKSITIGVSLSCDGYGDYLPASGTATLSPACVLTKINRGLMRVKVSGAWKTGRAYVKVSGAWKSGQTFVKSGGSWRRGI